MFTLSYVTRLLANQWSDFANAIFIYKYIRVFHAISYFVLSPY